jgi:hypothetical protein
MKMRIMAILLLVFVLDGSVRADLIVNGDFSGGVAGFSSGYTHSTAGNLIFAQTYRMVKNPSDAHGSFDSYYDHTTGDENGLMMVVNGATSSGVVVWQETVNVSQNVEYTLTSWVSSCYWQNPADLNFLINNVSIGTMNAPSTTAVWDDFVGTWDSGSATSATIKIVDLSTANDGNDFALDDISFTPEPVSLILITAGIPLVLKCRRRSSGR